MPTVNKTAVAAAFGRAASHYQQHDALQRQCASALLSQLAPKRFATVLDAGCGREAIAVFGVKRAVT